MRPSSPAVQLGPTTRETTLPPDAPLYRRAWRRWQRIARLIGTFFSRVLLTLIYIVFVTPFALAQRLFSDPLGMRPAPARWSPLPPPGDLEEAAKGF